MFDLGEPQDPNNTDTYYIAYNVQTNSTGTTTLNIERPNTFFNLEDI